MLLKLLLVFEMFFNPIVINKFIYIIFKFIKNDSCINFND